MVLGCTGRRKGKARFDFHVGERKFLLFFSARGMATGRFRSAPEPPQHGITTLENTKTYYTVSALSAWSETRCFTALVLAWTFQLNLLPHGSTGNDSSPWCHKNEVCITREYRRLTLTGTSKGLALRWTLWQPQLAVATNAMKAHVPTLRT